MATKEEGVAWYDPGNRLPHWLRDIWILTHPWYTLWHLAYVVIGASLATTMSWGVLGWTIVAFFLAMGIGAHCLDELHGRPLKTRIPGIYLWLVALLSIAGAIAIGAIVGVRETGWVIPCMVFGGFIVFAYNLELFRFFHEDFWFAFAWGAFPVVTAYVAQEHNISWPAAVIAMACLLYSLAQRTLSKQVRFFRRRVGNMDLRYEDLNKSVTYTRNHWLFTTTRITDKGFIIEAPEQALRFMTWAIVAVAIGLVSS